MQQGGRKDDVPLLFLILIVINRSCRPPVGTPYLSSSKVTDNAKVSYPSAGKNIASPLTNICMGLGALGDALFLPATKPIISRIRSSGSSPEKLLTVRSVPALNSTSSMFAWW